MRKFDIVAVKALVASTVASTTAKIAPGQAAGAAVKAARTSRGGAHAAANPVVSAVRQRLPVTVAFVRARTGAIVAVVAVVVLALVGISVVATASPSATWLAAHASAPPPPPPSRSPAPPAAPPPTKVAAPVPTFAPPADPAKITVSGAKLVGWALLHTDDSQVYGSANRATVTNTTESMIKPWIAADYLRRLAEQGQRPTQAALAELALMIEDSNDNVAEKYYRLDGTNSVTRRLIQICGLTTVTLLDYYWAGTQMSPQDAVKYGECLLDGRAAGPQWTTWILDTMRQVRGGIKDQLGPERQGGRWGIIDGVPANIAAEMSIKNGWTPYGDGWHINCLAVTAHWILAVMLRIPTLQRGADACAAVAKALVVTPAA